MQEAFDKVTHNKTVVCCSSTCNFLRILKLKTRYFIFSVEVGLFFSRYFEAFKSPFGLSLEFVVDS